MVYYFGTARILPIIFETDKWMDNHKVSPDFQTYLLQFFTQFEFIAGLYYEAAGQFLGSRNLRNPDIRPNYILL